MIVEYFGISGVGKSTIVNNYYKNNKSEKLKYPRQELYENSSWLKRNIIKFFIVFKYLFTNQKWCRNYNAILKDIHLSEKYKLMFNGIYLKTQLDKCLNNDYIYLFDEGVFQLIWAIYLRTNKEPNKIYIERIISLFKIPNHINIVDASDEIILSRLNKRKMQTGRSTKIMESMDPKKRIEIMRKKLNKIIECSSEMLTNNNVKIDIIDNNKEVDYER